MELTELRALIARDQRLLVEKICKSGTQRRRGSRHFLGPGLERIEPDGSNPNSPGRIGVGASNPSRAIHKPTPSCGLTWSWEIHGRDDQTEADESLRN